jgi:preprotein translocase subunit SecA
MQDDLVAAARRRAGQFARLTDSDLRRVAPNAGDGIELDEAAALAIEGTRRVLGIDLHDTQVAAGATMMEGYTVQMRTGEGKTFAAIAPALFYALTQGPVHVATANPYLAQRDSQWSGRVLEALGLSVGVTLPGMPRDEVRRAYAADVTFGAATDIAFDYLRDKLFLPGDAAVQRDRSVVIVDEADAVLIDAARTPLVLSGTATDAAGALRRTEAAVRQLRVGTDVMLDAQHRSIDLTEEGIDRCQQLLGVDNMFDPTSGNWPYLVHNALRARALLARDRDYIVVDGRVEVVDELTGRVVDGRHWGEGVQQAVEAKEGVEPSLERDAIARITHAGYFGGYDVVVGMSGTLDGCDDELAAVYRLRTVAIPTNRPIVRYDAPDAAFAARDEKFHAVADDVADRHRRGQPVLVGTRSIADTRELSDLLARRGIPHQTLTARDHHREAAIVAEAGRANAVTVATQMAGRGVDIVLDDEAAAAGGLMVWGLEHNPAHRLDMQLRGRSGRQGDPGESCFAACDDDEVAQIGQERAEALDRELREQVRRFDHTVDILQAHLYRWRTRAADTAELDELLAQAVAATRRGKRAHARLRQDLDRRRHELGDALFRDASQLIVRTLLVVLWPDALEDLDRLRPIAQIAPAFGIGGRKASQAGAVQAYKRFESGVQQQWLDHVLGFQLVDATDPDSKAEVALPASAPTDADIDLRDVEDEFQLIDWKGWSYNRFVREHWGVRLPEPPVVLVVDAISDAPTLSGLRLQLDVDDPTATRISR